MNEQQKAPHKDPAGASFFDFWQGWYEKEWKPIFDAPQFGLTRYYQEHVNQSMDKYCQLQGIMAQFASLLFQPIEKSLSDVHNELFSTEMQEMQAEDTKKLYCKWLSALEKQYMELYRSPDYIHCLNKTMDSFNDFVIARRSVLEDLLQTLPVPTHSDMDGLYKEFYELKKRIRDLEKNQVLD